MRLNTRSIFSMMATIAVLSACANVAPGHPAGGQAGGAVSPSKLQGSEWVIYSVNGKAVDTATRATLQFKASQLSGQAWCNSYFADYTVNGPSMSVKQIGSTRMGCDKAVLDRDATFFKQLAATQMWNIDQSGTLTLAGGAGSIVAKRK